MNNQTFFEKMERMFKNGSLIYAEKNLPQNFVRVKLGGHFIATPLEHVDFLKEIVHKMEHKQFFTEPQLTRETCRSSSYLRYEVARGNYALILAGKFKLYIVKNW